MRLSGEKLGDLVKSGLWGKSIASYGSLLSAFSIGSVGSILSIGSAGSILRIGGAGGKKNAKGGAPTDWPAHRRRLM